MSGTKKTTAERVANGSLEAELLARAEATPKGRALLKEMLLAFAALRGCTADEARILIPLQNRMECLRRATLAGRA